LGSYSDYRKVLNQVLAEQGNSFKASSIPSAVKGSLGVSTSVKKTSGVTGSAGSYMQNKANARSGVSAPLVTNYVNMSSNITNRMTVGKKKKDEEEERTWIKKGSDSIAKRILGTGADVLEDLTTGIVSLGEKAVDAFAMLAPYAENAQFYQNGVFDLETEKVHKKMVEESKKEMSKFVAKDLYDEGALARKILSGVGSASYVDSKIQNGGYLTEEDLKRAEELKKPVLDYLENDMEKDSVLGEKSDALVQSAGQLAGQFGLSMVGVPWFATSGVTSFGAEAENALNKGASYDEATGSSLVSAGAEILSEKLFGGDLFVNKAGFDLATDYLTKSISNKALRTLAKWGFDAVGEGAEEVVSQFISNLGSSLYREENLGEILFSEQALDEYLESFVGGFALGGVMSGINAVQSHKAEQKLNEVELPIAENVEEEVKPNVDEPPEVVVAENETTTEEKPKRVLYTGSANTDIKQFKVGGVDGSIQTGDRYGRGIYLTTNEGTAKNYAGENGRVYQTSVDDLNIFNLNDKITPEMKENLVSGLRDTDPQYRNSVLRNFRYEQVFEDVESAEAFLDQQEAIWKEQDGVYDANKPVVKDVDDTTGKAVIEYTDFSNWENVIGDLTGSQLYDALKSLSTDDFSSFITANGFDGISFDEDADNQQFVIYRNEDRIKINEPTLENSTVEQETQLPEENSTVSETENVAPDAKTVPASAPLTDTKYSVQTEPETEKPLTPAEKAQEYYRGDIWDRGDILSKLVNSGKTTMEAVNEATKQAQTLISKGAEGVKSIGEIFGRISTDGKLPDFEDYLHHMLNVDRCTLKERVGRDGVPVWDYTSEESQKEADRLAEENPEFLNAAEDVYAFMDYVMSVRVKSGKITQEQADRWKVDYPHYVPISRGGNADNYSTLLKFAEGDTSGIQSLDEFAFEADRAADVHKAKVTSHNFDSLMDTMVNAAFTAHWGLAISENPDAISQIAPARTEANTEVETPATETVEETQVEDETPSAERPPSSDAVQPADYESIKLMEQHDGVVGKMFDVVHWAERNILDDGWFAKKIDYKKGNRNIYSHWQAIRNSFSSAQYFIGHGNEAKGVRALNDIYAEIKEKGVTSDFDSYLAHLRNIDGMTMQARYGVAANHDFIKGVSAGQSYKEVLKLETEHPEFKQWSKDIYANTGYMIDQMVEHKMLSQDMADLFKELYPHFTPMRYTKNGVLESSLESLGQFTVETFNSFAMNDFALELKHTLKSETNREDMDIDIFIDRLDSGRSLFDFDIDGMDEDYHTFTIYEDGERKTFDITKEQYMAMNQTRNWMDWRIPVLYQANEGFRKATTELNWIFAFTNGVKDPQEILWNSQHPIETYAKLIPAEQAIWSKNSEYRHYYEEYLANGGEGFEYFNPNKNTFRADKGVGYYLERYTGVEAVKGLNGRIEAAPRLAEYIASRETGKTIQESMLDAAEVTVNFQAGGKLTKFLNRNGCTFLNASIQGALQHGRNIHEGKQNAWKGVTAAIAKGVAVGMGSELVKMINDLFFDDDEEYQNLPDYIKQDYYLLGKFGDGTWVRIPKGRTNATIEEAIRQVALSSTGNDEADWTAFWKLVGENMAPNNPFTNNLLAPIIEVKTNTSWYGEDIVPLRLRETKDENGNVIQIPAVQQYDEKTDRFSVDLARQLEDWFGEKLDFSPKKINYLINSYTGVVGDTLLPMGTPKAESPDDGFLGKLIAPLKDKFTTDAVLNHRVTGDFYETLEAAEKQAESSNATLEDKFKSGLLIGYNVEISELMKEQRKIQMDESLKNSEKYERTREIKKEINALQQEGLEALEDYSIDGIYAESGDKRYNYSAEDDTWWEIKPKLANGEDNWYYQQEQKAHDKWGVSYSKFWNNSDAYSEAVYVADHYGDSFYETAQHVIGLEKFTEIAGGMADIKADKDKNGESISGSRKKKMKAYIYDLDIPEIQKHILFKAQYPYDRKHAYEIVKYLDENDDISYEAFYDILDELGYKVDSNGRVTWW
jgi:hypothetical protein